LKKIQKITLFKFGFNFKKDYNKKKADQIRQGYEYREFRSWCLIRVPDGVSGALVFFRVVSNENNKNIFV